MQISLLTTAEENLMKILWNLESFYLKDIVENMPEPKPHQNTISTYLKILVEKHFVEAKKEGRIFHYSVIIPYPQYKSFLVQKMIDDHFEGKKAVFIQFLLQENILSPESLLKKDASYQATKSIQKTDKQKEMNSLSSFVDDITSIKKKKKKKKKTKSKKKEK